MERTPASLLEQLKQPNPVAAWDRFTKLYIPLLLQWATDRGLQPSDAEDLVQEVLTSLLHTMPKFQYEAGKSFRAWLRTVLVNKWRDHLRKKTPAQFDEHEDGRIPAAPDGVDEFLEQEHHRYLAFQALELMKAEFEEKTWRSVWEFVVKGRPAAEVAARLGMSENAVFISKSRVMRRLRQELDGMLD